jgi:hypothetical protein
MVNKAGSKSRWIRQKWILPLPSAGLPIHAQVLADLRVGLGWWGVLFYWFMRPASTDDAQIDGHIPNQFPREHTVTAQHQITSM